MHHRPSARLLATAVGALLLAGAAHAQVYRVVGPDGKVTFSDKPPAQAAQPATSGRAASSGGGGGALPYQLNQTVQRYPVTLYTSSTCAPCNSGRNLLVNRGVPFTEKTVETNDDIAALQRLAGNNSLPLLTIGGQQLKGFSDSEWSQYLDAAGYPKASQLPASYRRAAATPLVARTAAAAPAAPATEPAEAAPTPAEPSLAPQRTSTNPTGIRF